MKSDLIIREAQDSDFDSIWPIFHEIVSAGKTYAFPRNASQDEAKGLWMIAPRRTYVAEEAGQLVGTYYIKTNHAGPGSHVCNCGYMVPQKSRGKGIKLRKYKLCDSNL